MSKSTFSLADFLVRTSATPDAVQVYREAVAASGSNSTASSKKSSRATQSSKTSAPFAAEDWIKSSGHLLRSGMMRNGIVYPRQPLALLNAATASGSWPTPAARDYKGMSGAGRQARKGFPKDTLPNAVGGKPNPQWVEWLMGFPDKHTDLDS
jgi:hypothetical protein